MGESARLSRLLSNPPPLLPSFSVWSAIAGAAISLVALA